MKFLVVVIAVLGSVDLLAEKSVPTVVEVDLAREIGPVKPMHAVNNGPAVKHAEAEDQKRGNFEEFKAARIPYARTHDSVGCVSGGAIRAEGGWGAFVFSVKGVSFGETYAIGGLAKGRGRLRASWKRNGAADWTLPFAAVPFKDVGGEWGRALSAVRVPENCDELSLILSFDLAEGESVWLRDLSVAKVFTIPKDGSAK